MLVMEYGHGVFWAIMKVDPRYYDDVNVILPLIFNWSITSLIDVIESNNVLDNYPFQNRGVLCVADFEGK